MMIEIAIITLQFEVVKMIVHIKKIHTKRVKNTRVMHQNNNRKGSIFMKAQTFYTRASRGGYFRDILPLLGGKTHIFCTFSPTFRGILP